MDSKNNAVVIVLFLSINILCIAGISPSDMSNVSNVLPTTAPGSSNNIVPASSTSGNSYREGCPRDALQLGVCANVLNLVNVNIGSPPTLPCCSLIQGLVDLEAAACLCTAIRANILGINLNVPISLSLVLNNCGRNVPNGFEC